MHRPSWIPDFTGLLGPSCMPLHSPKIGPDCETSKLGLCLPHVCHQSNSDSGCWAYALGTYLSPAIPLSFSSPILPGALRWQALSLSSNSRGPPCGRAPASQTAPCSSTVCGTQSWLFHPPPTLGIPVHLLPLRVWLSIGCLSHVSPAVVLGPEWARASEERGPN